MRGLEIIFQGDGFKIVRPEMPGVEEIVRRATMGGAIDTVTRFLQDPRTRQAAQKGLLEVTAQSGVGDIGGALKVVADYRQHLLDHPRPGNNRPPDLLKRLSLRKDTIHNG